MRFKILISLSVVFFSVTAFAKGNVLIDGKKIKTREDMQHLIEKQLQLPNNSGKDLDAVYDELMSDINSESIVRLKHLASLRSKVGVEYVDEFIEAVSEASDENARVVLVLE
jgi:RNAse (barnase) inhibitor barstar